jgi:cytochrome c-type biogenesis protein CcmH/NrfG
VEIQCRAGITFAIPAIGTRSCRAPRSLNEHQGEQLKMTRQKVITILGFTIALASAANTGLAQTQATDAAQPAADQSQSALAQEATNPFASRWQLQLQQNGGERETFGVGPQIGKMCTCGGTPTLFQLQCQYYPVRPDVAGPTWNL